MNGTARFKKSEQEFEYQHLLLLQDIWWSKYLSMSRCSNLGLAPGLTPQTLG
jgi:hypothetical protein